MIHRINYVWNWPVGELVSLYRKKCEALNKKKIFDWIHYAFSILSDGANSRDHLMEKQIKLITLKCQNDINKSKLERRSKSRRTIECMMMNECRKKIFWLHSQITWTRKRERERESDAQFFMKTAPNWNAIVDLFFLVVVVNIYVNCVRLIIKLNEASDEK